MRAKEFTESYEQDVGYRGVSKAELDEILKTKHPLPSTDLMPFDNVIIELGIGEDDYSEMSQDDIEQWVQDTVPWYNGSLASVQGGVNYTTDESIAESYGDDAYIIQLSVRGPTAMFTDEYSFAKNYKDVVVTAYKKTGTDDWIQI